MALRDTTAPATGCRGYYLLPFAFAWQLEKRECDLVYACMRVFEAKVNPSVEPIVNHNSQVQERPFRPRSLWQEEIFHYEALLQEVESSGQRHLLRFWNELSDGTLRDFARQLATVDWPLMRRLWENFDRPPSTDRMLDHRALSPTNIVRTPRTPTEHAQRETARLRGCEILRSGLVGVLVAAGGQGTRLGFPLPKGMFPIGPVSGKTLFQLLAEKVLASSIRYQAVIPYLVMTSDTTHDVTVAWFKENRYFGLDPADVYFFQQGCIPVVDSQTGQMLLAEKGKLSLSADGHGGVLAALDRAGLFEELRGRGVEYLFYHQIDNPLVRVCDPVFLGCHVSHGSEASTKVVARQSASEKVGVIVEIDGRTEVIEYSDLPIELSTACHSDGTLRFWAGNTAIDIFNRSFLERLAADGGELPWHPARKKTRFVNDEGELVQPAHENGLKFERYIFDALPLADRTLIVETERSEEFAPLKYNEGESSPAEVRRRLIEVATQWLQAVGVKVPIGAPVEISPFVALGPEDLESGDFDHLQFDAPVFLDSTGALDGFKTTPRTNSVRAGGARRKRYLPR